jgi:hypothetical protein
MRVLVDSTTLQQHLDFFQATPEARIYTVWAAPCIPIPPAVDHHRTQHDTLSADSETEAVEQSLLLLGAGLAASCASDLACVAGAGQQCMYDSWALTASHHVYAILTHSDVHIRSI